MDGEWVNLLRTPEKPPKSMGGGGGRQPTAATVRVLENTPQGRVGVKKSKRSEVQVLRSQVAALVKEKRELALTASKGEELLNSAREELQTALEVNSQAKAEMEDQRRVVHRLSADNARLIRQVEMLWQQSPGLKSPPLTNHTPHPSPSPRDHTHTNDVLVKDLERLSQRATELSQALGTTQQARTALERELLAMKRSQLEMQTGRSQLEEALAKSEEERAGLGRQLHDVEETGRRRLEQLQLHMDTTTTEKTAKLEELLSLSERLQAALSSLSQEKNVLERSLREEVANTQQLTREKQALESHVSELETCLTETREELAHMQDHQLNEVSVMKEVLENEMASLQRERDLLSGEVEEGSEERENLEREVQATRAELAEAEGEVKSLSEEVTVLQTTLSNSERDGAAQLSQLTAQLAESTARSEELQREMEEGRQHCETRARKQIERLTNQLRESAAHVEQMEAERVQLQQLLDTASHDLQTKSRDLDSAHSELHTAQMTNGRLEQQVSDLESKVSALNEQISGRTELTNEMRALLQQRANQIQELEEIVAQQREEIITGSHTHLSANHSHMYSGDSSHILQATPIMSPYGSRPHSPEPHPLTTPPSNSSEVARLRRQLSESRQSGVRLQTSCEELRTELAKHQGSLQALTTIRDRLSEENNSLQESKRRAEEARRTAEEGRRRAEEGKRGLAKQLSAVQAVVASLRSQLVALQGEREEVMSRVSELEEAYTHREAELAAEMVAMEEQSIAASEQCETGEVERDYLQLELAKSRTRNTALEGRTIEIQRMVESERAKLQDEADRCTANMCTLRREDIQLQESCHLTAAVNAKQTNQIAEKEGRVSELMSEVEVLRARKAVVLRWLCDQENERSVHAELDSVREQLQCCQATHSEEVGSLTYRLRETEQQLVAARGEGDGGTGGGSRRPGRVRGEAGKCRVERRAERLRMKLKTQVEQTNYLRVKLGYTLKELQLYKDLKAQLDSQLAQQGREMSSLQDHYSDCLKQLQRVEKLGFQATLLPSPAYSLDTDHV